MATTTPPKVLEAAGRKFWRDVTAKYTLRADELRTLESACRQLDLLALVTEEWDNSGRPLTSTGSMGQLVEHPNLATMDRAQKSFEMFMKRLALPDQDEGAGEGPIGVPNQHRRAAQTKWAAAHGKIA
jgi:hypothetical protein